MMSQRYVLRFGKWGAYFHDTEENKDLTLEEVCFRLNEGDEYKWMCEELDK